MFVIIITKCMFIEIIVLLYLVCLDFSVSD